MTDYVFFTDSTADLSPELAGEMDAIVLPLTFTLNGKDYLNYPDNRAMSPTEFYRQLREGGTCITAQFNSMSFIEAFTPYLEQGRDILYIAFSSGLSGTYQASLVAAQELKEKFPQRTIECVDSLQASMGEGLVAYSAAMLRKEGQCLREVAAWVRENAQRFCAWFTVDDLMFLRRGGRLSSTAAVAGTLLGIKPVLHVDSEGRLNAVEKVRGRKASLDSLVRHYQEGTQAYESQIVFISHCDCPEDAQYLADRVAEIGAKRIVINDIGPVIGAHSGPGTAAIFYTGDNR